MSDNVVVTSPFTGGKVREVFRQETMSFRGENYIVHSKYYVCEDTGQEFTTTEQDDSTLNDLYAQYRIKHGIPFPDEIASIRKRYGLNQSQIGKLLGFGVNQWAKYEAGQVPSDSNGRLIAALRSKDVTLKLLKEIRDLYEESEYQKIYTLIVSSKDEDSLASQDSIFYLGTERSINNGFGEFNHRKVEEMVKFLVSGETFPTKLNKKMFYADFLHFKRHGKSISGLRYQAIHYGPVPVHFNTIYDHIPGLNCQSVFVGGHEASLLSTSEKADASVFSDAELDTLKEINSKLDPLSTQEIIELSHSEDAWLNNYPNMGVIPFTEAYKISLQRGRGVKNAP